MRKLVREYKVDKIISEVLNRFINESNEQIIKDRNGKPIVFYHSYEFENGGSLDSNMIWLSANKNFSKEFGNTMGEYYLKVQNPLVLDDDILRYEDGSEVWFDGEPATIGYFDSVDEEYQNWVMNNYDSIIGSDSYIVIVFDPNNLIPII